MNTFPALFISHGSPMHALEAGATGAAWRSMAATLPAPRAILIASAHWETDIPLLTSGQHPETIHDFSGFPEALYRIRYSPAGAPELAAKARDLLSAKGLGAGLDGRRGLDHGTWAPLLHMYPRADIPVVQLSVQPRLDARHHLSMGEALAPLREEGVLIIGSGHMTHNLGEAFHAMRQGPDAGNPLPYVAEFTDWVGRHLEARNIASLTDYRRIAPHAVRAHPTEEHFLPLFVALGAGGVSHPPRQLYQSTEWRSLAMDAWMFS